MGYKVRGDTPVGREAEALKREAKEKWCMLKKKGKKFGFELKDREAHRSPTL